jgi:hypothetical protein
MPQIPIRGPGAPLAVPSGDLTDLRQQISHHGKLLADLDFRLNNFEIALWPRLDRIQRSLDMLIHQTGADRDPPLQMHNNAPPPPHQSHYHHDGHSYHQGPVNVLDDFEHDYDLMK